ncbi:MAG: hypothetical protein Q9180_000825 [Flavoplaca navasiana]
MTDSEISGTGLSESKPSDIPLLVDIYRNLRNRYFSACSGFLVEAQVMELLKQNEVPFIRSWEASPVDGALIATDLSALPPSDASISKIFYWADGCKDLCTITFDVKYAAFQVWISSQSRVFYNLYVPRGQNPAQLLIIKFHGLEGYLCLLPAEAWEALQLPYSESDKTAFIIRLPARLYPFAVHIGDFAEACKLWVDSARLRQDYKNPTTKVILRGCRLELNASPQIRPTLGNGYTAYKAIKRLWEEIEKDQKKCNSRMIFHMNSYAPLIADFLIEVEGKFLRVEHKFRRSRVSTKNGRIQLLCWGKKNQRPFAVGRQWHFLIWELKGPPRRIFCIPKFDVPLSWATMNVVTLDADDRFIFSGPNLVHEMLEFIRSLADRAINEAKGIVQSLPSDTVDGDLLIKSSSKIEKEDFSPTTSSFDLPLVSGLAPEWLPRMFNQQCRIQGGMVLLPLDQGHPFGNYIVVQHCWTKGEQDDFDRFGKLPIQAYSAGQSQKRCVVLQFIPFHAPPELMDIPNLLWLRNTHWKPRICNQPYIILGGISDPDILAKTTAEPICLLLPSQFTVRPEQMQKTPNSHQGQMCIRRTRMKDTFGSDYQGRPHPFKAGSKFVAEGVDPLRFLMKFRDFSVYKALNKIVTNDCAMRIENPHSPSPNPLFESSRYHTTLATVNQAIWDFGVERRLKKATKATKGSKHDILSNGSIDTDMLASEMNEIPDSTEDDSASSIQYFHESLDDQVEPSSAASDDESDALSDEWAASSDEALGTNKDFPS